MANKLKGAVVFVAENGNLVTNITASRLEGVPRDERVRVRCDGHVTAGIHNPDHGQPDLTLLAIVGSDDHLELTLVGESASTFLGILPGSEVIIAW